MTLSHICTTKTGALTVEQTSRITTTTIGLNVERVSRITRTNNEIITSLSENVDVYVDVL